MTTRNLTSTTSCRLVTVISKHLAKAPHTVEALWLLDYVCNLRQAIYFLKALALVGLTVETKISVCLFRGYYLQFLPFGWEAL
jgi:hypothetical protein